MNKEQMDMEYPKVNMVELLRGLLKSAMRFLVPGIVLIGLMTGFMLLRTWRGYSPRYQASASFSVQMKNPFYATQQYYNNTVAEQMAKTFPQILTSGLLSDRVMEEMGIAAMPAVSASAIGNTNIFTLTVTSADPQLAYDVLNCVMEVYPSVAEFVIGSTELSLLSESGIPTTPTSTPDYFRAAILGATIGCLLWAGLALLYWLTHKTITSEEELSKVVNLPCLGFLPRMRGSERGGCPILTDTNDKFGFNESVRLLRVRVEKALAQENGKVLLVTSTIPNEGKTTVSVNLATALAQRGKKVLLVDCDLRNPSIASILSVETRIGFAEFLKGECALKDILHKMQNDNLYVVLGGKGVRNPGRLLTQKNAKNFVDAARAAFDYVILDTPPCAMMADAVEMGVLADAALLTVRHDFAARQQIQEAAQSLSDNNKPIIGTVLNMTTPQLGKGSYHSYGYGYSYGYYGSYGNNNQTEEDKKA